MDKATEVQATMEKLKERIKDKKYKLLAKIIYPFMLKFAA